MISVDGNSMIELYNSYMIVFSDMGVQPSRPVPIPISSEISDKLSTSQSSLTSPPVVGANPSLESASLLLNPMARLI